MDVIAEETNASIRKLAGLHLAELRAEYAAWEAECARYHEQGFNPHYCVHGANLWVDYDIPCGTCEQGATLEEQALALAQYQWAQFAERMAWLNKRPEGLDHVQVGTLVDWAMKPIESAMKVEEHS